MSSTLLIIDDDERLNALLTGYLGDFGFHVLWAVHPSEGLKKIKQHAPDLVILDLMLPEMDGFEVCKAIRKIHALPIIMLTAKTDLMDRVVGLELGADDYLTKPFEPRELVARIHSVLRRTHPLPAKDDILSFGNLTIFSGKREATLNGLPLDLTTNEFDALVLLTRHPGKILNRDQILQELRGMDCEAFNRSVDITMSRLRQKLQDDPRSPRFIKTVRGTGYVFIGEK
jgi:DNA-binding response OmpR family regulator